VSLYPSSIYTLSQSHTPESKRFASEKTDSTQQDLQLNQKEGIPANMNKWHLKIA